MLLIAADPLMVDIAREFQLDRPKFRQKAEEWTAKYACQELQSTSTHGDGKERRE